MTFDRLMILASIFVYGAIGIGFILAPQALGGVVGIELTNTTAHNDFRAVYGGVPAGLAVFFVMALRRREWTLPALWTIVLTLGGLAASRVYSWIVDGWAGPVAYLLHGAEIGGVLLTLLAIRQATRTVEG